MAGLNVCNQSASERIGQYQAIYGQDALARRQGVEQECRQNEAVRLKGVKRIRRIQGKLQQIDHTAGQVGRAGRECVMTRRADDSAGMPQIQLVAQ